jgi:hypothetical protein
MRKFLMNTNRFQVENLNIKSTFFRFRLPLVCLFLTIFAALTVFQIVSAQATSQTENLPPTNYRIGEKLTYNVTFGKFKNAAYAEIYAVSRGKLGEKDAVELRSKIKTNDFVGAAFYFIDESRTTFASSITGFPLYIRKTTNISGLPKETVENYTVTPTANYDLLTLIYQARNNGGIGNFPLFEDEKNYTVSLQNTGSERVVTDAGDFETSVSSVTSEYLTEKGIKDLKINFSVDEVRIPALIRFKTDKGDFRVELASLQSIDGETMPVPTTTPTPIVTPVPTPKPIVTPTPVAENQPLLPDLSFKLGETLEYKVSTGGRLLGLVTLQAKERKQFLGQDSLLLAATVTGTEAGNNILNLGDGITAQVNPDSLAPKFIELKFTGILSQYNQTAQFDQKAGTVTFNGRTSPDVPVGTHSLLSLVYAIRSFNLKPSKDPNNPVNDTRVAVFLDEKAYVFTLRPSNADLITLENEKIPAQMISITTGNPAIDQMNLRLWLSTDEQRTPLRLTVGAYQADLFKQSNLFAK